VIADPERTQREDVRVSGGSGEAAAAPMAAPMDATRAAKVVVSTPKCPRMPTTSRTFSASRRLVPR
jgi:hypothetical protein